MRQGLSCRAHPLTSHCAQHSAIHEAYVLVHPLQKSPETMNVFIFTFISNSPKDIIMYSTLLRMLRGGGDEGEVLLIIGKINVHTPMFLFLAKCFHQWFLKKSHFFKLQRTIILILQSPKKQVHKN